MIRYLLLDDLLRTAERATGTGAEVVEFVLAVADGSLDDPAAIAATPAGWTPPGTPG